MLCPASHVDPLDISRLDVMRLHEISQEINWRLDRNVYRMVFELNVHDAKIFTKPFDHRRGIVFSGKHTEHSVLPLKNRQWSRQPTFRQHCRLDSRAGG